MNYKNIFIVLVLLVIPLAGCNALTPPASDDTPRPTAITTPHAESQWTVTITRVLDGDTMEARFPNGEIDTLRLLGVDTPETTLSRNDPTEFDGIPDTAGGRDHLLTWGERATVFAATELENQTVRIVVDPTANRRDTYGRLLVYIHVDEENFNKRLLTDGYARVYPSTFTLRNEFEAAEATAQEQHIGLWKYPAPDPDPPSHTQG